MTHAPFVIVIVLHWLNYERTSRCLRQLEQLDYPYYRVLLVDNGSHNGSFERLQAEFPTCTPLALPTNRGFAGGINPALRQALEAGAEYVLLLNNDALAPPDLLTALIDLHQQYPQIGVLAAKVVDDTQPARLAGLGCHVQRFDIDLVGWDEPDQPVLSAAPVYLDAVFGAATLLTRRLLEQAGLFDERFFFYYEDIDLCVRARAAGLAVAYAPAVTVRHAVSSSTAGIRGLRFFYLGRARQLFFRKYNPGWRRVLYTGRELYRLFREAPFRVKYEGAANVISYLAGSLAGLFMPVPAGS